MIRLNIGRFLLGLLIITSSASANDLGEVEVGELECVVRFASEVKVPSLETGRIAEINIKQNDMVAKGAPIARLDDRSLLIRRRSVMLKLESAKSEAEDDVEIRYAEVALKEAEAELETSRSIQNDVRGAIPLTQIRKLRLAVERGILEVAQAKKRSQRAQTEQQLRDADLSEIDDQIRNLHAESPIAGIVLDVAKSAGEWVNKGDPIATIGLIERLHVHALVSSKAIAPNTCVGLPVSVHWIGPTTGLQRSLRGKILSVDPQNLPDGKFRLHAEIINQPRTDQSGGWMLQPGTSVRMTVYQSAATASRSKPSAIR